MAVSPHLVVHGDHRTALGRRLRFVAAAFVLLIVLAAGTALRGARLATAPSSGDSELYAIHAAIDDLNREFFRPVKTSDLLQSAWNADAALATKNGVPIARVASPRLTEDADASFRSFDASYRELNRIATGKATRVRSAVHRFRRSPVQSTKITRTTSTPIGGGTAEIRATATRALALRLSRKTVCSTWSRPTRAARQPRRVCGPAIIWCRWTAFPSIG